MLIDKLIDRIIELNNPVVVGLDPQIDFVPKFLLERSYEKYGETCEGVANAFLEFNKMIIDEIYDIVPAVKPQIAMYEKYGVAGVKAYNETINYAKEKGLIIIGDIKRGDIASTGKCYADGHIGEVVIGGNKEVGFDTDFVTLNAYLGYDSIEPFIENMKQYDKGAFVLVKTSNKGSSDFQDLILSTGETVYEKVGDEVKKWGSDLIGKYGYSNVGAVVGGTHRQQCIDLRKRLDSVFFLVPGYGAQGGLAEDIKACFDSNGIGAIVNSSRGIIAAYKSEQFKCDEKDFATASRKSALYMKEDLGKYININKEMK